MQGSWNQFTGFNAPLYKRQDESGDQVYFNVDWAVQYWINIGAPRNKIILGLGMYGRTFKLANAANTDPGAAAVGPANAGRVSY